LLSCGFKTTVTLNKKKNEKNHYFDFEHASQYADGTPSEASSLFNPHLPSIFLFLLFCFEMLCDQQLIFCTVSQPHRGRNDGGGGGGGGGSSGGGRHKKRVRQPHNTREKHRELAINKGEYISPQNALYQSPQVILSVQNNCQLFS
jgi:hypothetical protein